MVQYYLLGVPPLNSVYICYHFPRLACSRCWWRRGRREILFVVLHPICFPATWLKLEGAGCCFNPQKRFPPCIQGCIYRSSPAHLFFLHIFSSSSRAGWNMLEVSLFFVWFFRFSQPDEESFIFSQRGLQNFWARLIFSLVRSEYQGLTGMVSWTWYLEHPGNIDPKTRAVLVNALRIWWLYKSVNFGLSEVLEFSREMYYFFLICWWTESNKLVGLATGTMSTAAAFCTPTVHPMIWEGSKKNGSWNSICFHFWCSCQLVSRFSSSLFWCSRQFQKRFQKTRMSGREL